MLSLSGSQQPAQVGGKGLGRPFVLISAGNLPAVCAAAAYLPSCRHLQLSVYEPLSKLCVGEGLLRAVPESNGRGRGAHALKNWVRRHLGVQGAAATAGERRPGPRSADTGTTETESDNATVTEESWADPARNTGDANSRICYTDHTYAKTRHRGAPRITSKGVDEQ